MNKKAIVFTFIVVALLSVVLIAFLINISNQNTQADIQDTTIRVETLNSFTKSLDELIIPQALKSSSNRAILSWLNYLDEINPGPGNSFLTTDPILDDNLKNAIVYEKYDPTSTFRGDAIQLTYMYDVNDDVNFTLPSIFKEIEFLAINSGVNFTYDNPKNYVFTITQISPWEINVSMTITNYKVSDVKGNTFWTFNNKPYSIILNVTNYVDPLMLVYNNRTVTINRTSSNIPFDSTEFKYFYQRPEFIEDTRNNDAPSFLDRLQGSTDANINGYGIESVLDPLYFENTNKYSNVDFQYWNAVPVLGCLVNDLSFGDNVYLDQEHLDYYGIIQTCNQQ